MRVSTVRNGLLPVAAVWMCAAFTCALALAEAPTAQTMRPLTAEERAEIDAKAIALTLGAVEEPHAEIWSDLAGWLVATTPLPLAEEVRCADEFHQALLAEHRVVPTPEWVDQVFKRLVDALPAGMRPEEYQFGLTVLDEPRLKASTLGAGRVDIGRQMLESIAHDERHRADRLAFVLGRELGRICQGHCRWGYQLRHLQAKLDDEAELHLNRDEIEKLLEQSVCTQGKSIEFRADRAQTLQADFFALQLCRMSGYDVENALDVLRFQVVRDEAAPSLVNKTTALNEACEIPSPLARLQRLRNELDGRIVGDDYGLFEFDRKTGKFTKLADRAIADGKRALIFVHGIDSHFGIYRQCLDYIGRLEQAKEMRLVCFHYPNDDSLARSGKFLHNELARVGGATQDYDFICHSAGGLVFRYYAEVERGQFRKAVLQGTPHAGSDLVKLRMLLEAKQFLRGLRVGMPESIELALRDGRGQLSNDLKPESLFLQYLNSRNRKDLFDRYYIFRGQAIENEIGLQVFGTTVAVAKIGLQAKIARSGRSELLADSASALVNGISIPREVSDGDLAVSLDSAALEGAALIATYHANHIALVKDPVIIKAVADVLFGPPPR